MTEPIPTAASAASPETLEGPEKLLGKQILDFELKSVLGQGGMSVVYRGVHRVTAQEVAIKILPPELAVHDELKARFVEEARLLAKLEHPNIVTLNNFTESGGRLCLIMQYVEGVTFEQKIIEAKQVAPLEAVRVGIEVLKALEHAHKQNIIHRDIKPSNVLVRSDGVVKVTDFGIAKMIGQSRLTSTGQTMGTVRYMSPEQVRGKPMDARSDVYSLGVTLFEALAGRTPFDGDNQFAIMEQHLNKKPPQLSSFGAEVPASVERALLTSLNKSAQERYPDAAAFRSELERVLREAGGRIDVERPLPAPLERTKLALVLGGVVALGAAVAAFGLFRARLSAPPPAPSATDPARKALPWPEPHALAGVIMTTDQRFAEVGLRVQSAGPGDVARLSDQFRKVADALRRFLAEVPSASHPRLSTEATRPFAPLNLVIVPQAVLDRAELWPGYEVKPKHPDPSRYVATKSTLFLSETAAGSSVAKDLSYGLALHVLARIADLSNDECLDLAEKFEAYYTSRAAK
jgi:serine/threonine-protein kinase